MAGGIGGVFCDFDVMSGQSVDTGFAPREPPWGQQAIPVCCGGTRSAFKAASRSNEDGTVSQRA